MQSGQKLMQSDVQEGLVTQNTDIRFQRKAGRHASHMLHYRTE